MIQVDFCTHDHRGTATGRVCAVTFSDDGCDCMLNVNCGWNDSSGPRFRWVELSEVPELLRNSRVDSGVKIGHEYFACRGWRSGGNWSWESTHMASVDALRLANYLMTLKHWDVDEAAEHLFDAWKAGRQITKEEWLKS